MNYLREEEEDIFKPSRSQHIQNTWKFIGSYLASVCIVYNTYTENWCLEADVERWLSEEREEKLRGWVDLIYLIVYCFCFFAICIFFYDL